MKAYSTVILAAALAMHAAPVLGAEAADPAVTMLNRMREQLRTVMIQQQKTEADRAAAEAAKVEVEGKLQELDGRYKKLVKDSNAQKADADKTIAELRAKVAAQELEQARLQEALANWKKGHADVVTAAKKLDAQRAELAARVILQDRKLADYKRKNDELFKVGTEVLGKYEGFGLGTAIAAREPFTRNMRVKMETLVQDYGDKLVDNKIKPESPPPSKKEAAQVQKPVTQSAATTR